MKTAQPKTNQYELDWIDLAFASKSPVNRLKATFIAAPRDLSTKRFAELVKTYLPQGNIVLGIAKEPFVAGFEGQPQFKTLSLERIQNIIAKVNGASGKYKIYNLSYFQRETIYLLQKLNFARCVFINGSWQYAFHTLDWFYSLVKRQMPFELASPFTGVNEAREYQKTTEGLIQQAFPVPPADEILNESGMLHAARTAAKYSYDYNFQTGLALGNTRGNAEYNFITAVHNKVVPYETYAMLHGAAREANFSPPNDLNYYDTVHAEIELLIKAAKHRLDLAGSTVFINLLPCPPCSRALCETDIAELVYEVDHSSGYAIRMLEHAGKKVRRAVA